MRHLPGGSPLNRLALIAIVRDAEDCLPRMLDSALRHTDIAFITDTGSVDATPKILESYGVNVSYCTPDTHPQFFFPKDHVICDFAGARNFNLDQVPMDVPYLLWIDADDTLEHGEHLPSVLDQMEDHNLDGAIMEYLYSYDTQGRLNTTHWRERVVKHDPAWRWEYPVHEAFHGTGKRFGRHDTVKIKHWRHLRANPRSTERNLRILLAKGDKENERIQFYLGMEYAHHHKYAESRMWFEKYLQHSTSPDEFYMAHHYLGSLARHQQDFQRAIEYDLKATMLRPEWRDAYMGLVQTFCDMEDWGRCIEYAKRAEQAVPPQTPFAYNPLQTEVGWLSHYAKALAAVGRLDEAYRITRKALDVVPENLDHLANEVMLARTLNHRRGLEAVRDAAEFLVRKDDTEGAALLVSRLAPEDAQGETLAPILSVVGHATGQSLGGQIPEDEWLDGQEPMRGRFEPPVRDPRLIQLVDVFARRPDLRRVIVFGGPPTLAQIIAKFGREPVTWATGIPVPETMESFDIAISFGGVERVERPETLLREMQRLVKPGGLLVITTPASPSGHGTQPVTPTSARLRMVAPNAVRIALQDFRVPAIIPPTTERSGHHWWTIPVYGTTSKPRDVAIVCPRAPESWGPASLLTGIGGSEEMVIRFARTLVRRGHRVVVYGSGFLGTDPVGDDFVRYRDIHDYEPCDWLLMWRAPHGFLNQIRQLEAEIKTLWLHDSTPRELVEAAAPFTDHVWGISQYHAGLYAGIPNVIASRNGIDPADFLDTVERDPTKCVYLSSPFRGLDLLLDQWPAIRARVPQATLHAFYGFQSADKMGMAEHPLKAKIVAGLQQPGVVWRDRIGQDVLASEIQSAGVWTYPTRWAEEQCLSAVKAQAGGAVPVTYPLGALPETVCFGVLTDETHYAESVQQAMGISEPERSTMMRWARRAYAMDTLAEEWEMRVRGVWVP